MTRTARAGGLILSESRILRLFSFFLFYVGQGLPVGITVVAMPAWMAANGVTDAQVGQLVAWAYFAWTYKFIVAALMDRFTYLPMGRRRIWLIAAQFLMAGGFVIAAIIDPGPTDYTLLVAVTMIVMTGAATQDVAVDGLAVDLLPEKEQGMASSFMFGAQAFGMATAGAAAGAGLQFLGAQATFFLFIPVLMIPTIYAIVMRERPGERRFPWSEGEASPAAKGEYVPRYFGWDGQLMITLRSIFKGASLWLILSQSLGRIAGGIMTPMIPILGTSFVMLSTAEYTSTMGTIDLTVSFVCLGVGSWLTLKLGAQRATVLVFASYAALMLVILFGQQFWKDFPIFLVILFCWSLLTLLSSICSNPLRMQLSDKRVGATQFTIYNSLANLPVALGAWLLGWLGGSENLAATVGTAAGLFILSAVGFALLRMPGSQTAQSGDSIPEALGGEVPARVD